jgi:hypothetical protein
VPSLSDQPGRNDHGEHDSTSGPVTVGVDTHLDLHVAAVVDQTGRLLGTQGFPASTRGYVALVTWAERFGPVERIGVEGTGTYGAGLTRFACAYASRPSRSTDLTCTGCCPARPRSFASRCSGSRQGPG